MPWNQAENKDELGGLEQRVVRSMSRLSETTYLPEVIQSYRLLKKHHTSLYHSRASTGNRW